MIQIVGMHRLFLPTFVCVALAGCDSRTPSANAKVPVVTLAVTSDAFGEGQAIPGRFTCDGAGQSPPLRWSEAPASTKSFAIVVTDPDAPGGLFRHWGAFGIPAATRSIGRGQVIGSEAVNDFGKPGYGGPCPPKGEGWHRYRFNILALDVEQLGLSSAATVGDLESAAQRHLVGRGELTATYERR